MTVVYLKFGFEQFKSKQICSKLTLSGESPTVKSQSGDQTSALLKLSIGEREAWK